jgi:ferredoxin
MSLVAALLLARASGQPPAPPAPPPPPVAVEAPRPPLILHPREDPQRPLGPDVAVGVDDVGDEIVILARKLRLVHVHLLRTGRSSPAKCTILRSSGDTEVDQITCDAAIACARTHPDRNTPAETMNACTKDEQARRVEELAEKRIQEELNN